MSFTMCHNHNEKKKLLKQIRRRHSYYFSFNLAKLIFRLNDFTYDI